VNTIHEHTLRNTNRRFLSVRVLSWIGIALLFAACGSDGPQPAPTSSAPRTLTIKAQQTSQVFENTKFLLYLPPDYAASEKRWPLLLYLHGGSLRGDDLEKLKSYGLAALLDKDLSIPFVVVSPQCPADQNWEARGDAVVRLVDNIAATYSIDPDRIYVTGHSLGGRGTWFLAYKHPEKFAAIVPMAAAPADAAWAKQIAKVPAWVFHGTKDDLEPFDRTEKFVATLKKLGADVKLTPLPDRDHYILDTYENKEIYDWLLTHSKERSK
jgi:predicted peptidase